MKVLSLFSGIGGFDLGLERAGMEVTGFAEIDAFGSKVLAHHWPGVPNYGDVRNVGLGPAQRDQQDEQDGGEAGQSYAARAGHVDLICGGFPCQDLSVAGKRAGLDGARSGLWFEFHRILSELRPSVALIENVPGLLSSNQGRDFGVILRGLDDIWPGRWGWAVLDSQHFGVAQRRRRLYVIAGPRRERIAQILSLCESGDWHSAKSREAREDVASTIAVRTAQTGSNGWGVNEEGLSYTLDGTEGQAVLANTLPGHHPRHDLDNDTYIPTVGHQVQTKHRSDFESETLVALEIAHTLKAEGFDASEDGTGRGTPLVAVGYTIHGTDKTQRVASETGIAGSLRTKPPGTQENSSTTVVHQAAAVRRLTPTECERLQGFPDGWTKLDDKTPDGPRYKALGNAVTVPVIEYIGRRIKEVV